MSDYGAWVGRSDERRDVISVAPADRLAATLDLPAAPAEGDPLPALWHWLYFLPAVPRSRLGPDGHPRRGDFYPDIPLRRRMFAGGRITIERPLVVGERAVRRRSIAAVEEKSGSTGPLVLVRVLHEIESGGGGLVTEEQTIVYTDAPPGPAPTPSTEAPRAPWRRDVPTDAALLFRFSALTFNSHRIHYDLPYARDVEGYPGLVVHGPLTAILLAELARSHGVEVRRFRFRARAPVYCGETLHLRGTPDGDGVALAAYGNSGPAVSAEASS